MRISGIKCGLAGLVLFVFCEAGLCAEDQYIQSFDAAFTAYVSLNYNSIVFSQNDKNSAETYISNRPFDAGFGFAWGNFSLGFNVSIPFLRDTEYSKSKSSDAQLNYHGKKFFFEIQGKDYKGFHDEDSRGSSRRRLSAVGKDGQNVDLEIRSIGIFGQYLWNHEEYSMRAAFDLTERQLKSAGSFLLGADSFYSTIFSPESFLSRYNKKNKLLQFGPNAGYAYTWVYNNNLFLAAAVSLGLNVHKELNGNSYSVGPAFFPRFAVGYHMEDWSFNFMYTATILSIIYNENESGDISTHHVQLTLARRF
ncbi:MAG: DUF4421 domain-containing protein [Spirochaetia bacterium]|jgi:hypothetical protein|nr:DUF4421 domain-containing protein [Spirochaetia bacterium]